MYVSNKEEKINVNDLCSRYLMQFYNIQAQSQSNHELKKVVKC